MVHQNSQPMVMADLFVNIQDMYIQMEEVTKIMAAVFPLKHSELLHESSRCFIIYCKGLKFGKEQKNPLKPNQLY